MRRLVLLLCALMLAADCGAQSPKTLRLSANYWEPYTGPGMANNGVATEIVVRALARAGYATEISFMPWSRTLASAYHGKIDGVVGIWPTRQRRLKLLFSDSYLTNRLHLLYVRPALSGNLTLDTLDGIRIGVGRDYDYSDSFLEPKRFILDPVDRIGQNLSKLFLGRIDMMLEDPYVAEYTLLHHADEFAGHPPLRYSPAPLLQLPLHFGLSRDRADAEQIIAAFNTQLARMKKDGSLAAILQQLAPAPR